jgi:hypothetical protein
MGMSVIKKITLVALDATPHMCNGIHMQLVQLNNNYLEIIIVQLLTTIMVTSC